MNQNQIKNLCNELERANWNLMKISENARCCKDVVLDAVSQNGFQLQYASDWLKNDKEVALAAIKNTYFATQYIGDSLKEDVDFGLAAVERNPRAYEYLSDSLRENNKIARLAVKLNSYNYQYAPESIKKNRRMTMKVINDYPYFLQYADESLRDDYDLVLKTVKLNANALAYASDRLKSDKTIVSAAVSKDSSALRYAPAFADDDKIVLTAVKQFGSAIQYASDRLKSDDSIIREAIKSTPCVIECFLHQGDYDTKENKELCKEIAKKQNVQYFVHFTNAENLSSILQRGLLTRKNLDESCYLAEGRDYHITDSSRLDNMRDTISLSVTIPNRKMFYVKRRSLGGNWCVLRMKADTILDHNCYFFRDNAAYHGYNEENSKFARNKRNSCYDFMSMFTYSDNENNTPSGKTTNSQAEVMCGGKIPINEIDSVVFHDEESASLYRNRLKSHGIEAIVDETYFY